MPEIIIQLPLPEDTPEYEEWLKQKQIREDKSLENEETVVIIDIY